MILRLIIHGTSWKGLSTLWRRTLMGILEGLHHWKCHCCRKSPKCHQAWNNTFRLERTVTRSHAWLHRSCNRASQENHERDRKKADMAKKGGGCWRWYNLGKSQDLTDATTEERAEDDLREVSFSELALDDEGEGPGRSRARTQGASD